MSIFDRLSTGGGGEDQPPDATGNPKERFEALAADIGKIASLLKDKHLPVERRERIFESYREIIQNGNDLTNEEVRWVPPRKDPSTAEIADSLANLQTALETEVSKGKGGLSKRKLMEFGRWLNQIHTVIEREEEFSYAFKEHDVKKEHGRLVQSIGVRDDVDPDTKDGDGTEIYAGPRARHQLQTIPRKANERDNYDPPLFLGTGVKRGNDATIPKNTLYRHTATLGVTGYGKSTLLTNNIKQLIENGDGVCFIDPKGDDSRRIAEIVPDDRKDELIWIEPGSSTGTVSGFNFINVGLPADHPQIETAVSALVDDLKKMLGAGKYWGPRMDRIAGNIIRAMNIYNREYPDRPDLNLADFYYVLMDARSRHEFAAMVKAAGIDFIEDYTEEIAEMEDDKIEPILGRMQPWIESPAARRMICFRKGEVNIPQAVEEGKIIIVRMGGQPDDLKQMLGMAVVRRIWATIRARAEMAEHERSPFYLFVDEAHHIAMADNTFPKMLAAARSLRLSINLATQYLSQLPEEVVKGIRVNCDTFMSFNAGSKDEARKIAPQLDLDPQSLLNESRFHIWLRQTDPNSGELTAPFKVYIHPPFPPMRTKDEADDVIERSLEEYGRPKLEPAERKARLQFHKGGGQSELGVGQEIEMVKQDSGAAPELVELLKQEAVEKHRAVLEGEPVNAAEDDEEEGEDEFSIPDEEEQRLLECIYAVRVKSGLKQGEPVRADRVKEEIDDRDIDFGHEEKLADLAEGLSQYIKLGRQEGEETLALTNDGRSRVFGSTGEDITGGDVGHRRLLREAFKLFTRLGYQASLPTQEGKELPDGLAETPFDPTNVAMSGKTPSQIQDALEERLKTLNEEYPYVAQISEGRDVSVEAESSTQFKPAQCLTNLRKAIDKGHHAVYVTKDAYHDDSSKTRDVDDPTCEWAHYIERVIHDTEWDQDQKRHIPKFGDENLILAKSADEDGHRTFYNLKTEFRVQSEEKALRRATEGRSDTTWKETDGGIVALQDGEPFAQFDSPEAVAEGNKAAVPAYYHYDKTDEEYVVTQGGKRYRYNTSDELFDEWETFKAPFLPQAEFPEIPTEDDYTIIVIPDPDNPLHDQPIIYDQGEMIPLYEELGMDVPEHALIQEETIHPSPTLEADEISRHISVAHSCAESVADRINEQIAEKGPDLEETAEEQASTGPDTASNEGADGSSGAEREGESSHSPPTTSQDSSAEQYLFPEVEALDDLPDTCPRCNGDSLTTMEQPFAGPASGLENFPKVCSRLTGEGVLDVTASPPMVTEMIDATVVSCSDCSLAATIYVATDEESSETIASPPQTQAESDPTDSDADREISPEIDDTPSVVDADSASEDDSGAIGDGEVDTGSGRVHADGSGPGKAPEEGSDIDEEEEDDEDGEDDEPQGLFDADQARDVLDNSS